MSNFNNKYGESNSCPAVMNDGRGVLTNFKNNKVITQELKKELNANTSQIFRNELQNKNIQYVDKKLNSEVKNFGCNNNPHGNIKLSDKIVLDNGGEGSFLDHFKPLL